MLNNNLKKDGTNMGSRSWRSRAARHKTRIWAALVLVVVLFWLWRGHLYQAARQAPEAEKNSQSPDRQEITVQVTQLSASDYQPQHLVQGQFQAERELVVRARTDGVVEQLAELGQTLVEGERLLTLSLDDRQAALSRAEAEQKLNAAELKAAERLSQKGLLADTELLMRRAAAAAANAALAEARLALDYSRPTAPFAGTVNARHIETGDYVRTGDSLLMLVNDNTLTLSGFVPQQKVAGLTTGLPVTATALDGRTLSGTLSFVAAAADSDTRSFAVEARFDNPQGLRLAGASAELTIHLPARLAHRLSPALLALDEQGRTGVHLVDEQNRLQLVPVTLLAITPDEAWVTGLPEQARVVTRGAGFITPGEVVAVQELRE